MIDIVRNLIEGRSPQEIADKAAILVGLIASDVKRGYPEFTLTFSHAVPRSRVGLLGCRQLRSIFDLWELQRAVSSEDEFWTRYYEPAAWSIAPALYNQLATDGRSPLWELGCEERYDNHRDAIELTIRLIALPASLRSTSYTPSLDLSPKLTHKCKYLSHSSLLRCAVHPMRESCEGCMDMEIES